MTGHPAHDPGIFDVDLSLYDMMPESRVIFSRRSPSSVGILRQIEADEEDIQPPEDLTFAGTVQGLFNKPLQRRTQQNKADIAVFGAGAGFGGKRNLRSLGQQLGAIFRGLEQLDISGEPGRVRQQHPESNSRAARIVSSELRQDFHQFLLQVKLALIV